MDLAYWNNQNWLVANCVQCHDRYFMPAGSQAKRVAARMRAFLESHRRSCGAQ